MPRNMSFAMTTDQVYDRSKDVTRRFGWWFLKAGDQVWAVEKAMGLRAGEKVKRISLIRIVSVKAEPLNAITQEDCAREGFPSFTPHDFVSMLCGHYGCPEDKLCNRIEFEYLNAGDQP
ncbi:MAG: hypothetical protein CMM07_25665 [Rhodopirellula sp.]|nr:hypothetical protein [Rhodopirellula sp.]